MVLVSSIHSITHSLTHTHRRSHSLTQTLTCSLTHTHTPHTHLLTLTGTHSHAHTQTTLRHTHNTHTHSHSPSLMVPSLLPGGEGGIELVYPRVGVRVALIRTGRVFSLLFSYANKTTHKSSIQAFKSQGETSSKCSVNLT